MPFHLTVSIDGRKVFDDAIRPAGVRNDRPAYVFQEFGVAPGSHELSVRFSAEMSPASTPGEAQELITTLDLAPRDIALVTRDERGLVLQGR
jgi:hypothetical protein